MLTRFTLIATLMLAITLPLGGCKREESSSDTPQQAPASGNTSVVAVTPIPVTTLPPAPPSLTVPPAPAAPPPVAPLQYIGGGEIRVAATADLTFIFPNLVAAFHKNHPEVVVTPTFGASGILFDQISSKAPFDLFLSADGKYPEALMGKGIAPKGTAFKYAHGKLVIWAPKSSKLNVAQGLPVLLDPSIRHIIIANPQTEPYGKAAVAALNKKGLYSKVQDRLLMAENVAQAAQFIQSGGADVGIIAESLAISSTMKDGKMHVLASDLYPAIEQSGIILPSATDPKLATEFKQFLIGPAAKGIFKSHGFSED